MKIKGRDLHDWLLEQIPKPVAIEISYRDVKNEIIGVSYYKDPDGIVLRHPISPRISKREDIKNTEVTKYGFTILEENKISHRKYYGENTLWSPDKSKFDGLSSEDEIIVENLFYDDDSKIKPIF